jgi:hypothetical protein
MAETRTQPNEAARPEGEPKGNPEDHPDGGQEGERGAQEGKPEAEEQAKEEDEEDNEEEGNHAWENRSKRVEEGSDDSFSAPSACSVEDSGSEESGE